MDDRGRGAHGQQPALQAQCQDQRRVRDDRARARAARAGEGEAGDRPVESADRPAAAAGGLPGQPGGSLQLSRPAEGAAGFRRDDRSTWRNSWSCRASWKTFARSDQAPDEDWPEIAKVVSEALAKLRGRACRGRPGDGRRADRAGARRRRSVEPDRRARARRSPRITTSGSPSGSRPWCKSRA